MSGQFSDDKKTVRFCSVGGAVTDISMPAGVAHLHDEIAHVRHLFIRQCVPIVWHSAPAVAHQIGHFLACVVPEARERLLGERFRTRIHDHIAAAASRQARVIPRGGTVRTYPPA